jgi:hypothetical protein
MEASRPPESKMGIRSDQEGNLSFFVKPQLRSRCRWCKIHASSTVLHLDIEQQTATKMEDIQHGSNTRSVQPTDDQSITSEATWLIFGRLTLQI